MSSKIRFSVPKQNSTFTIVINIFRPELDLKLNKMALTMPKEFQSMRFSLIEKDRVADEVEKFLLSLKARKISKLKILGLISCEIETQFLEKLTEHSGVKFVDLNESNLGILTC